MSLDALMMPATGLVLAASVPQLVARGLDAVFARADRRLDLRAAIIVPSLAWVGLISFWGVRWIGPEVVDSPNELPGLLFGASLGALAGLSSQYALNAVRARPARGEPPLGLAIGLIAAALLVVSGVLLYRKTDLRPEQVRQFSYDDEQRALQLEALTLRAQVEPWDPEIYLVRAWHSVQDGHLERAMGDLSVARRAGASAASLHSLEADALAAMGRCDDARVAFDAWQRARAADAMATHFGHELEVLASPDEDESGPSRYLIECHELYYGGE